MRIRSVAKLASVLALTAVATTACASKRAELDAEQAKAIREASVDSAHRREVYLQCVLDDANAYALDPSADVIAAADVADLSLAKCRPLLGAANEDFGLELFSGGEDVVHATAMANRATDVVRTSARGQAIAQVVDARRKRSSTPARETGS